MAELFTEKFAEQLGSSIAKGLAPLLAQNQQRPLGISGFTRGASSYNPYNKATVTTGWGTNFVHGTGGYLAYPGLEPEVISAMLYWVGLGDILELRGVRTAEVLLPFITGVDPLSSTERATSCGDCISGETEACVQAFPLGLVCRETKEMEPGRIIERLNRGDIDLRLLNDVLGGSEGSPWQDRSIATMNLNDIMQIATAWALLFERPPLFMQALAPMVWTGNPNNNIDRGYMEFRGLNLLINTGHVHVLENVTCPALDSDVKDFNYGDMARDTVGGYIWYQHMEMMHSYVLHNARRQRLMPADWVVVMRPEQWQIASGLIPLQSVQAAIMNSAIQGTEWEITMDGSTLLKERDAMRENMLMPLNGRLHRVVEDDGITELNNATDGNLEAGEFAADNYLVPIRYLGNRPATWIEYKDFRFLTPEIEATDDLIGGFYRSSPDGRFNYNWVKNGKCFKIQAEIEPRIILRTPQLAGRLQRVKYVPMQHLRSPDPDSPYRFKGGVSTRTPDTRYY